MLRRTLLVGILGFIMNPFQKPALGIVWFFRAASVGVRLLRGLRTASRATRAFNTGIRMASPRPKARPRIPQTAVPRSRTSPRTSTNMTSSSERARIKRTIRSEVDQDRELYTRSDREQLVENIWDLTEKISDVLDLKDAMHLVDQWAVDNHWDVIDVRLHVADCKTCNDAFMTLTRGTDIQIIPITNRTDSRRERHAQGDFSDEVTIRAEHQSVRPQRELVLPQIPNAMRSFTSGKSLTVRARVNVHGKATVISRSGDSGLPPFVLERAEEMIERTRWKPAKNYSGRTVESYVNVIFRWP